MVKFMDTLYDQIKEVINLSVCNQNVVDYWLKRLEKGKLTRDSGNLSHFCCYFLPYNLPKKQVFIVHHKKSGLWLFPGGHIDEGETLMQTLNREIEEELGVLNKIKAEIKPFLLTVTPINHPNVMCKEHLDIWYRFPTDGSDFEIDPREFYETKWVLLSEARVLITDLPNLEAIQKIEEIFAL